MSVSEAVTDVPRGLGGVVVDTTGISDVNGADGVLTYRGVNIDDLVEWPFSEVAMLVVRGDRDPELAKRLDAGNPLTVRDRAMVVGVKEAAHPMHLLQGVLPLLETRGPFDDLGEAGIALNLACKLPEVIAGHWARESRTPLMEATTPDFNTRFLERIGASGRPDLVRAFNVMQILQIEHSFNASTFAARVIASTLAPIQNALAGGVGALHGVLHGGADQLALETADRVGNAANARDFVDQCLREGTKVMGMGHREYRVVDPRAKYAKSLARTVTRDTSHFATFETLEAIESRFAERMAEEGKQLHANIEFYKGLIYRALGLPTHYFTALFAMARIFGYVAHVLESRVDNQLIRPVARYRAH